MRKEERKEEKRRKTEGESRKWNKRGIRKLRVRQNGRRRQVTKIKKKINLNILKNIK
jgi:hypothetical protein